MMTSARDSFNQSVVQKGDYASQRSITVNGDLSPVGSEQASPSPHKACGNLSADEVETPASAPNEGIVTRSGKVLSFVSKPLPTSFLTTVGKGDEEEASCQNEAAAVSDAESCDADSDELNNCGKTGKRLLK